MHQSTRIGASEAPIGFVGLGAMGGPMVRHLCATGLRLWVYDLNPAALEAARQAGASVAASPADVANRARLIFVCLPSLQAARVVLLGPEGIQAGSECRILFDLSTTGPDFAREMQASLADHKIDYLDSPITGNVTSAGNGRLGLMCAGSKDAYEYALPVLETIAGSMVLYLGQEPGRAQTLKLLNNLVSASGMALTSEAFVIGAKMGLRAKALLHAINTGEASTNASRNKFPSSVLNRQFDYGARMAITAKDISLATGEAEKLAVPLWVARQVQQLWRFAASQGGAERDGSSLITYLEPWAGVEVRGDDAPDVLDMPAREACESYDVLCGPGMKVRLQPLFEERGITASTLRLHEIADAGAFASLLPTLGKASVIVNTAWWTASDVEHLQRIAVQAGHRYVEAPLPSRAKDIGVAPLFVGGDVPGIAAAVRLLEVLGAPLYLSERVADIQRMRHIEEALSAALFAVACESYVTAAKAGLPARTVPRILGIETGRTAASAQIFPEEVLTRRFQHGRTLGDASRALDMMGNEAEALGISAWALSAARLLYRIAVAELGADADMTALAKLYETWAGVEVRDGADEEIKA
ncbi:NAD-binding protein [Bordetella sp. N]|uniref:NAD-binding protein n=1 Tax=Bordetella sp. N TaxID=1746199 RepID=UPI000710F85F|nr:NAD-binding protein [Bordetella sp. N]ALM84236.1 hypothetical protein ASB57_15770 [Bordetella sp. N]